MNLGSDGWPLVKANDQYPEEEAQRRFMAALKAAVNTPPKPLKDVPRKWSGAQRMKRRKKAKAA
jgi:hypothetical protein